MLKDVKAFLDLVQFYRKFVKDCSKIAAPLHNLIRYDCKFVWSTECKDAFQKLKQVLATAQVLKHPELNNPFRLYYEACRIAFGTVLAQLGSDK